MDKCSKCQISNCTNIQCNPKGCSTPKIYFIGEAPGPEEHIKGEVFIGRAGKYLHNILDEFGLNVNNCRFNNVIRCYPEVTDSNGNKTFRAPNSDEITNCIEYLDKDIEDSKPSVIVTLGGTALRALFPDTVGGITVNRGNERIYKGIKVIPTYHPSYLMRRQEDEHAHTNFRDDIKSAIRLCSGTVHVSRKINNSETEICKNYLEFDRFCRKYIDNYDVIAYDIETNSEEVHSVSHKVVGFSLASSKEIGCYVTLSSLDYVIGDTDKRLIEKRLRNILLNKRIVVYNSQHELPATYNWLDIEIPNIDDVFVMVKLITGSNSSVFYGNRGLKAQSKINLNYEDWSKELDKYFTYLSDYKNNKDNMINLLKDYYEDNEIKDIIDKIEDLVFNVLEFNGNMTYEMIPYKIIGRYGSLDSSVLLELLDFYRDLMTKEGKELNIDLFRGYKYWMWHHYCGYTLEKNGAFWNDKKAQEIEDWCNKGMHDSLRMLIESPLSEPYIKDKLHDEFLNYLKDNYLDVILGHDYTPKRLFKSSVDVICNSENGRVKLSRMSLLPKKNKDGSNSNIYKLQLGNIETLAGKFLNDNPDLFERWYRNYIDKYINETHSTDEYRKILNPAAVREDFKEFMSNLLVTNDIKNARLYFELRKLTEDPSFYIEYYMDFIDGNGNNVSGKKFSSEFDIETFKLNNPDVIYVDTEYSKLMKFIEKLSSNSDMSSSLKLDMFMKYISNASKKGIKYTNGKIVKCINSAREYKLESLDAGSMNEIYDLYTMCHIDVDDKSTWNDQFEWLYNYMMFKKFSKIISTYINGRVGRGNVYTVNKDSYESGDYFTRREHKYVKGEDYSNKSLMMQQEFKVNMADTGRWKSGMHNLPAGETVKSIFTSRFRGGCIGMPDGSQMEVRTLAAECKDENLLKAFKDGLDIHRYFASRIYQVDYDKVEPWQRGLAKNAVFGMIYGESERAFADIYLKGDLSRAQEIFKGMFDGFPRIKEFIDRAQNQFREYGKVTTMTQRYINLNDPKVDFNRQLRQSQNYPIQAAAEDLAGIIMYQLCSYIKENNMKSKPFCFIHDSIEVDFHPQELFQLLDKINWLFNVYPMQEFGVPVECDVPLGPSMGQECIITNLVNEDNYREVSFKLEGFLDDIYELYDIWNIAYKNVKIVSENIKGEKFVSMADTFLPKKAKISMKAGTYRKTGEVEFNIITR